MVTEFKALSHLESLVRFVEVDSVFRRGGSRGLNSGSWSRLIIMCEFQEKIYLPF